MADWVTLRSNAATLTPLVQTETDWLELEGFRGATMWVQTIVTDITVSFDIQLQTSPTPDDALFQTMASASVVLGGVTNVVISRARNTVTPLAKYLRWSVVPTGATTWDLTFRMFVCLNPTQPEFRIARSGGGGGRGVFTNPMLNGGS